LWWLPLRIDAVRGHRLRPRPMLHGGSGPRLRAWRHDVSGRAGAGDAAVPPGFARRHEHDDVRQGVQSGRRLRGGRALEWLLLGECHRFGDDGEDELHHVRADVWRTAALRLLLRSDHRGRRLEHHSTGYWSRRLFQRQVHVRRTVAEERSPPGCPGWEHSALRELLADDVQHARIGWAHLASSSVTKESKMHVAAALPTLLGLSQEVWTSVPERAEPWFADHGCLGRATARRSFAHAIREVVLPGMAHVGVDPAGAARWAERHLPPPGQID
jgi:hypothetical protein